MGEILFWKLSFHPATPPPPRLRLLTNRTHITSSFHTTALPFSPDSSLKISSRPSALLSTLITLHFHSQVHSSHAFFPPLGLDGLFTGLSADGAPARAPAGLSLPFLAPAGESLPFGFASSFFPAPPALLGDGGFFFVGSAGGVWLASFSGVAFGFDAAVGQ